MSKNVEIRKDTKDLIKKPFLHKTCEDFKWTKKYSKNMKILSNYKAEQKYVPLFFIFCFFLLFLSVSSTAQ